MFIVMSVVEDRLGFSASTAIAASSATLAFVASLAVPSVAAYIAANTHYHFSNLFYHHYCVALHDDRDLLGSGDDDLRGSGEDVDDGGGAFPSRVGNDSVVLPDSGAGEEALFQCSLGKEGRIIV